MKFYVTKFWATQGLFTGDGVLAFNGTHAQISGLSRAPCLKLGSDAFTDLESARKWMRQEQFRRCEQLARKLERIRKLDTDAFRAKSVLEVV